MKKKVLLLVNLGTPEAPTPSAVGKYLTEFLNDPRVIDLSDLARTLLVNLAIVPIRKHKSARLYRSIWTKEGSPLLVLMQKLTVKIRTHIENKFSDVAVDFAMRYGKPSIHHALIHWSKKAEEIIILPLYPQYASSTSGSSSDEIFTVLKKQQVFPSVHILPFFFHQNFFLKSYAQQLKNFSLDKYDAIVFSYHGLPNRHIQKCAKENGYSCLSHRCCVVWNEKNFYCYRAQCEETTRLLAQHCGINIERCYTTFQSRLSRNWLNPFTDQTLVNLARSGKKRVLVAAPAFVTDCLETIHELGVENKELFLENGGIHYDWVPSLNDENFWAEQLSAYLEMFCP